jgi:hypothetical protein
MTVEQIIDIPADYRILLELPRTIPTGVKARVAISVPITDTKSQINSMSTPSVELEEVRRLLQKEMTEKGTSGVMAAVGDGWEAHVRERYAES